MLNPEKFDTSILQIFPAHLSDVGTLLWDTKESHFQHYYSYTSDYLRFWDTVYILKLFLFKEFLNVVNEKSHNTWW